MTRGSHRLFRLLASVLPLVAWSAVIFLLSTQIGSSENTGRMWNWLVSVTPEWIARLMTPAAHDAVNAVTRKVAHMVEYAVLAALAYRTGLLISPGKWKRALGFCLVWCLSMAVIDEIHQSFEPSRTSSVLDVGWDLLGVALGVWAIRRVYRQSSASGSASRSRTQRTKRAS